MPVDLTSSYILTADIGGSHITAGLYDTETKFVLAESFVRMEVNSNGSAYEIMDVWQNALRAAKQSRLANSGLAIAMPGPFDYVNGISYIKGLSKYESIFGINIKNYLAEALAIKTSSIYFRNDAESTIAGEVLAGAGKNYRRLIGITLGTGFGSAFADEKNVLDLNLGSNPFRESIADDYFSTRWFHKRYLQLTGKNLTDGVKELAGLAEKSELARGIFYEFADNLAEFIQKPVFQLEPEALLLCGSIAKASRFFLPRLAKNINSISLSLSELGEYAPLIGAAAIVR
ncbi:ROK family protein [Mucilaginibacter agri]|uniref:ROK family protein n=1 Tax=Mucilaginibacter agri TaxID=2695265 RepID=A0A966DSR3_9SPHI|nr:ROK family protein [Mucilaginibacter agri]NCD68034.1 ROK family protein [Mucilaginibacter agri]